LVKTTSEPAGATCTTGGVKIEYGIDANTNGVLDLSEVNNILTKYICNGAVGEQGPQGIQGLTGATGPQGAIGPASTQSLSISGNTLSLSGTNSVVLPSVTSHGKQKFTTTGTFTVPDDVSIVWVTMSGGGGGGGGSGGGGGADAFIAEAIAVTPGSIIPVNIGIGGAGNGGIGINGGTSSFLTLVAVGGYGGSAFNPYGGPGGNAGGPGGSNGVSTGGSLGAGHGGGSIFGSGGTNTSNAGGYGGGGAYGGGNGSGGFVLIEW
jgi:hypothetical protein